nr:transposase (putative), gypsy type [Tanacetum cinerariifolium]
DTVQLETAVNTISHEYLLEFTSEYGIPETLHPVLPGLEDMIIDFSEGKVGVYTSVFSTVVDWRSNAPKDGIPAAGTYSVEAVRALDTHRTLIQKQPEMLLCLVGLSRRYYLGDEVFPTFLHDNDRDMDLFSLIRAPNPTKVKVGSRSRASHEVPLLTLTANRVIEMDDPATTSESSGVPPTIERPPLDFSLEAGASDQGNAASEVPLSGEVPTVAVPEPSQVGVAVTDPPAATESRKRSRDETDANAPPNDPDPLCFADPPVRPSADVAQSSPGVVAAEDLESENASSPTEACQDLVDHVAPPGYFPELRHMRNEDFLGQYNVNLARQVALGSHMRLRFEQEAKLLRKSVAQVARRDKRIKARELEIKNLEALLETEADMKRAAEDKSAGLIKELEDMRARFSDLRVSHGQLSQQVASLKEQVSGEEKLKAAFEEFKRYEDERVERRCAELDALSIDFDEELYPHMLTAIAGRRWVVGHELPLAMMKCAESLEMRQPFADVVSAGVAKGMSEGLKHGVEHGQAQLTVESIEAYDPEAEAKFIAALQSLKDLKYPLLDQLEGLKDAPMDVIMAALYLECDTEGDAPQYIRDLHPSSSQLTIPVYPEVRNPRNPWAYKEEIKLSDAIAENISRAEKKKKCRIVCRTHGVSSAHHARSDGVPVSVPTVVPQGLALLLVDAAMQTDLEDAQFCNIYSAACGALNKLCCILYTDI